MKRWLVAYLRDRRIRVEYNGKSSSWRKVKMGVPQGSVLSPLLFNFFVNDISSAAAVDQSYADDFHGAEQAVSPQDIATGLSSAAAELSAKAEEHGLSLSAPKSTVTLFTPWSREYGRLPPVTLDGEQIPQVNNPKLLGVVFDPMFYFNAHAIAQARKARAGVNIIRALSDTSFGHDKECLTLTFKSLVRPFFDYCAPIVFPLYSQASINRLQVVQNSALRRITGCHSLSSIDHLHQETKILPVEQHLKLLTAHFLVQALHPSHPSHEVVNLPPGPRQMKDSVGTKVGHLVSPFLVNGVIPDGAVKSTIDRIHTDVVADTISSYSVNRVLNAPAPELNPIELSLPRPTQVVLAQLRSGFCSRLNDYQHRLGRIGDSLCPDCLIGNASTNHLFDCPAHPTQLTPADLWTQPYEVARFLNTIPAFSHLPATGPPPQRRQRRRPPPEPPP